MRDLVDTTEMYLRTIFELEEEGITPLRARIAERLEQSGPTVSQTVARMERDGLLTVAKDRSLKLSQKGRETATAVMRKHRLAERLLTDIIGLPWEQIHDEACRWEHVMGDDVERRLISVLDEYGTSPFGNPIPGLHSLLDNVSDEERLQVYEAVRLATPQDAVRASDLDFDDNPRTVTLVSFNEIVQVEHKIMAKLAQYDMKPGAEVQMIVDTDGLTLSNDKGSIQLSYDLSHAIRVRVDINQLH